jgi:glycerol-3-phosphate dehydrogenase
MSSVLSPDRRRADKERLAAEHFDVLVVGGGIVGVGAALDAASRGLSVALVEARDLASGTSSRSSKLVHGGVRYLEQLEFGLVREALVERGALLQTLAPHLVRPVRFVMPLTSGIVQRGYFGAGLSLYDLFSRLGVGDPGVDHHRHLSQRQLERAMPGLKKGAFRGALTYFDGRVDDARLVLTVARTAAEHGAAIVTRTEVTDFLRDGERVVGARVRDDESGLEYDVHANSVVLATGVWTERLASLAGEAPFRVSASKGIHITVPRDRIGSKAGVISRTEKSVLFIIPWGDCWLIGTTDTAWAGSLEEPPATGADIDYVLDTANAILERPLTRADIIGTWSGLRPLVAGKTAETTKLSREHVVAEVVPGLTAIAGGKLTTYRVMAEDVIDAIAPKTKSTTLTLPLHGAPGFTDAWENRAFLASRLGLTARDAAQLLKRHGDGVAEIVALATANPKLGVALAGTRYLEAEVVHAVTHEGARTLDDVVTRRLRLRMESREATRATLVRIAELAGAELGWGATERRRQVRAVLRTLDLEHDAEGVRDDAQADSIRNGDRA